MSGVTASGTFSRTDVSGAAGDRSRVRLLLQGSRTNRAELERGNLFEAVRHQRRRLLHQVGEPCHQPLAAM
jgi:hypothetical protein